MYSSSRESPSGTRSIASLDFAQTSKSNSKQMQVQQLAALANNCNNDFDFYLKNYCRYQHERGNLYTWGSGEMGQLGYNSRIIQQMPKDRDGYPFQPFPLEIEQLRERGIYQIAGGDGHTVAVDTKGNVYSWGASACGQLGLSSMKDLPTDIEGYPYQPTPRLIELLNNVKVVQIACGDAHTVALTFDGRLYSWGGGGCGQLGHPDTASMPKDEDGCPYQPKPKLIVALKQMEVKEVSCGKAHTVAVIQNGNLYSWGAGACGQLGHPDTSSFPADEDGYPYQPIPRCVTALKTYKLTHASCGDVHTMVLTEGGEIYCFGGGSCGQLGFGDILQMPLDVDRCPFMPVPKKIESLQNQFIVQLACGDSHSMALTKEGFVYAWGEASFGQLGLDEIRDLPKNNEHKPYQPYPTRVQALSNKKIVQISCGETHTQCLSDSGHLYSFGANGCGQLGQFMNEFDRKRRNSFEEITFPRITNMDQQLSFLSESSNSRSSSPQNDRYDHKKASDDQNIAMVAPLMSPPPLYSANDYGIETICQTPKLVKSLMHKKVIRISSGGVHNICIVEAKPSCILSDVYQAFMQSKLTNVVFKGFYTTVSHENGSGDNVAMQSQCSSDEETPNDQHDDDLLKNQERTIKESENYWRERQKISSSVEIRAHMAIFANKSSYFHKLFKEKMQQSQSRNAEIVIDFGEQVLYEAFRKITDYFYLDDINVLESISDSTEMLEIIKLAKLYKLNDLFRAAEIDFSDTMFNWLETSSVFSLKPENVSCKDSSVEKDSDTQLASNNKNDQLRGRVTQQVNQQSLQSSLRKKRANKPNSQLQGMMFLPDGRVLIMDPEVFRKTVDASIVLDLFDSGKETLEISGNFVPIQDDREELLVQTVSTTNANRMKDQNNRKQSQANQKRRQPGEEVNMSQALDSIAILKDNLQDQSMLGLDCPQSVKTRDLLSLLNQKDFSDITLMVEGKPIYCHQVVLASRSVYFEAQFRNDFAEKDTRIATYNDVPYEFFIIFLKYLYSDFVKVETKHIYELLQLADRFSVPSFKRKCEQILAQHINVDSVCQIFKYANTFNCERLKETCLLFTEENHTEVLASGGFEDLDKEEILKIVRLCNDPKKRKRKGK